LASVSLNSADDGDLAMEITLEAEIADLVSQISIKESERDQIQLSIDNIIIEITNLENNKILKENELLDLNNQIATKEDEKLQITADLSGLTDQKTQKELEIQNLIEQVVLKENERLLVPANKLHIHANPTNRKSITLWVFEGDIVEVIENIRSKFKKVL